MKLLIIAELRDRTLLSKILPLMELDIVDKIYLVRRNPFNGKKIKCFSPKGIWGKHILLSECFRFFSCLYLVIKEKPDVLIGVGLIPNGIYAFLCEKLTGIKTIQLIKGKNDLFLTRGSNSFITKLLLYMIKKADYIGVRGENSQKMLEKSIKRKKIFIPHNIFDFNSMVPHLDKKKIYDLIYIGNFHFYKRVDLIIKIAEDIRNRYNKTLKLLLIGDGPLKAEIIRKVKLLDLKQDVSFVKYSDLNELNTYLNQSKIFIMTSQGDGLPMAMIEALSCGLPVVISDDADIPTVIKNGENGFLVKVRDVPEFSNCIYKILADNGLYKEMSCSALKIREEKAYEYSVENVKNVWKQVLTSKQ